MNITKEQIKETIKELMSEDSGYKAFFKKALEKAGKSIPSMSDEEKKSFFNKIDAAWDAKGEKNEGNAFGAAVTKAKETGEDEFEVGGKTYKVEESAGCGCGCGGCSDSVNEINEAASDRDFEKVFNLFNKKDYFHLKGSIKTMLGNWQRALDKGDKGAQKYSKEDIINAVTTQTKVRAKQTYDDLVKAINKKDINVLKSKLRHDQKFSLAIFTQVTGKKLPKSTRDIHSFLDNEFINESINEDENPCWDGYEMVGMKMKDGKEVPNCVPKNESVNEIDLGKISSELEFEIRTFIQRPIMENISIKNSTIHGLINTLVNEGIGDVLTDNVKDEFNSLVKKYK